jgi:hypothetical protein
VIGVPDPRPENDKTRSIGSEELFPGEYVFSLFLDLFSMHPGSELGCTMRKNLELDKLSYEEIDSCPRAVDRSKSSPNLAPKLV